MKPYRLQQSQALISGNKLNRLDFCHLMQEAMEDDDFAPRLVSKSCSAVDPTTCCSTAGPLGHRNLRCATSSFGGSLTVHVPPLPTTVDELKNRIVTAVESVTKDMLERVREEFEYSLDIARVTMGSHTEHL